MFSQIANAFLDHRSAHIHGRQLNSADFVTSLRNPIQLGWENFHPIMTGIGRA